MLSRFHSIWGLLALFALATSQNPDVKKNDDKQRLGLLATSLGIPPVPGYDAAGNQGGQPLSTGTGPILTPSGGFQGGKGVLIGGHGNGGGGFQGGNNGGKENGGGFQGGNGPCQCVPIEHCPTANNDGGYQGGNLPIIGGGGDPNEGKDPGYGGGGDGGDIPSKDGIGVIDIRIVNKPPKAGGVQCLPGQIFCCGGSHGGSGGGGGKEDYFPGGGYSTCGKRQIIDVPGWTPKYGEAQFGAYPWMAVILGKGNNYIGAGALLNSHYVLTAAHKIQSWKPGTYMKVRLGEWNAQDDSEPHKNVEIEIENVEIHPDFNPESLKNDVALIKLSKPIDTNAFPHIKSVCLPKGYANDYVGKRCWVAGFGKDAFGNGHHSFIMREVDLPVVEPNTCENLLRGTRLGKYFELDRKSFICAGGEEGKDACTGDGGSPLVCEINGTWNVVGLVAWGIGCADYAVPGAYVNVLSYLPWIEGKINNFSNKPPY